MGIFTRSEIEEGLKRLGELAQARGIHIQLTLVGGAVMVLQFDARSSTRDIDAVILEPREARLVRELAKSVAEEFDWTEDWLNDGAKGYLVGISNGPIVFQAPGIEARTPSLEQLLAMKLSAWRDDIDVSDARRLLQEVGKGRKKDDVWQSVEPFLVKGDELTAQYAFWDLWENLYGTD
ncbi:MAG: nucleotidyltransferase [Anaerolineae bacterium]|nr:nucleotidyltransferase [Anaerolineae bacterium]MBL8106575.1 nucleotidyltransferase [Anaerolineales bacterium]